ncbi:peptidoglycan DD-metalloendopeptidase family protein [Nocardia sp. NPDC052278]|uniref:M23 family metallopeptidase n=1 Tax=unclassified Nocardia TaxID=2637762 RepID=UPI0036937CB9
MPVQHCIANSRQSSGRSNGVDSWQLNDQWSQADSPFSSGIQSSSEGRNYAAWQDHAWQSYGGGQYHGGQGYSTGQNQGAGQINDANHDYGDIPLYSAGNGSWHGFPAGRDESLDWNGGALQDHGASQSDGTRPSDDAGQNYNANHDYGDIPLYSTSDGSWHGFGDGRDQGLDWYGRATEDPGKIQSDRSRQDHGASQSDGTSQHHSARQDHGASLGHSTSLGGDSLLYSAGNADWRGFDGGLDEGVDWDGIALRDRDVARRDDALRNRGGVRGGSDFGGGARDVEGRAGTSAPADSAGQRKRRGGAHRVPAPPRALKGRAAVIAVAAGAIVAAGQNLAAGSEKSPQTAELQAVGQQQALEPVSGELPTTPELLDTATPTSLGQFSDVLENGDMFAQDLEAQVEATLRPLFMKFASGSFTSGYGERWGVLHPGVDVAAPIGTPIYAVEDGTVIDAGPAAGFGMWVRMRGDDGTVTVYGHINTALVSVGQHVLAGDEIATVGNRGESTGPHCHFEVWLNGTDRIDPLPWLATRGISLGQERD